jgi:predicted metal-dependent peptidase
MTNQESISKITKELMLKEPYYGLFLIMTDKVFVNDNQITNTACVSKNNIGFRLTINENYWNSIPIEVKRNVIKHELMHIVFFHLFMFGIFKDKHIANIAMDLEVNQYIDQDNIPEDWETLDRYPELALPEKAGAMKYYELLEKAKQDGSSPNLTKTLSNGYNYNHDWREFEDASEAEQKLLHKQLDHQLKEIASEIKKSRGLIPSELVDYLKQLEEQTEAKFDWRGYLRRFVGNSNKIYTKKLRSKYNKRFEDNPGLKIKKKQHILVAVDTSGSVSNAELQEFFSEIDHIHKTGVDITVIQCDAAISNIAPYSKDQKIKIYGRGGTSFQPVIDHFNNNSSKFTSLVYFTDGEAPSPTHVRGKILWVLSNRSRKNDSLPGFVIQLN